MQPNITIFVQILHFFIAFILLRRYFLRPAVHVLEQREAHEEQLIVLARIEETNIQEQQKKMNEAWQEARVQFGSRLETLDHDAQKQLKKPEILPVHSVVIDNQEALKESVARVIQKKVDHVS